MDAKKLGRFIGLLNFRFKVFLFWKFKKNIKKIPQQKKGFIFKFMEGYSIYKYIPYIACDNCGRIGIDYEATKHKWIYLGYHFWNCPKCGGKND